MLRYWCMLLLLLTILTGTAQERFTGEAEVRTALNNLRSIAPSHNRIVLLLKLSDWYLLKQNRTINELERSYSLANEAIDLSVRLKDLPGQAGSYLQQAKTEGARNNLTQAENLAHKAIALFTTLRLPDQLGESYVALWTISSAKGISYPDRIQLLKQADTAFKTAGNKQRQADCLIQIGDLYQVLGDWANALPNLNESLRLYQVIGYKKLQAIYDMLGTVNFIRADYKASIEYGLLAAKTAEETGDSSMITCTINNHIGMAYQHIEDIPKAKSHFEKALAIAIRHDEIYSIETVGYNYTILLLNFVNTQDAFRFIVSLRRQYPKLDTLFRVDMACLMIDIYLKLNMPEKATPFCKIAENELTHNIEDYQVEAQLLKKLFSFYFQTGDYSKAAQYSARYDSFCKRVPTGIYGANNLYFKFKLDSAQGNYVSAINYYQRYIKLKDSLFNTKKSKEINQLNILYETEKKDKNIHVLEQQAALQVSRIKQEKVVRNSILAGTGLLVLVLFLLYKAYKTKQEINKVLEAHQKEIYQKNASLERLVTEKEWLVKEIHHRVKNNLHMVVGLLASQAEYIKGQEALDAINESQNRIQAMSLIHQKLYQAENLSSIDMPAYIHELIEYLQSTFDNEKPVRFTLNIARVAFPLSHSIPIGLILNEAVTNAIKYAFPAGNEGRITISLTETAPDHFLLSIHDNGIGLPPGFHAQNNNTLGTTLMNGLSGDINASFSMKSEQGTHIDIEFTVRLPANADPLAQV